MLTYSDPCLDYFYKARAKAGLKIAENTLQNYKVLSATVGDHNDAAILYLQIEVDAANRIQHATFKCYGGVEVIAVLQWLVECIDHQPLDNLSQITSSEIIEALQLSSAQYYAALMAEDLLRKVYLK